MCLLNSRNAIEASVSARFPWSTNAKASSHALSASACVVQLFHENSAFPNKAILEGSDCCIGF